MGLFLPGAIALAGCAAPPPPPETPSQAWAQALIDALGSESFDERARAEEELGKKLPDVEALLRENVRHPDAEIAARCRALLARLEKPKVVRVGALAGKIALVDARSGRVATDLRDADWVCPGQKLGVWRDGRPVGALVIREVQRWGSWAGPDEGTRLEELRKGDLVAPVEER